MQWALHLIGKYVLGTRFDMQTMHLLSSRLDQLASLACNATRNQSNKSPAMVALRAKTRQDEKVTK
jgi:hypothetical protein